MTRTVYFRHDLKRGFQMARKLSKRMLVTLQDAAKTYNGQPLGTHAGNNGFAAYTLEKRGLVYIEYPFAYATAAGREVLRTQGA